MILWSRLAMVSTVLVSFLWTECVFAKRAPVSLNKLISKSDTILLVEGVRASGRKRPSRPAGRARLLVLEVWKGRSPGRWVDVRWSHEEHDQPIRDARPRVLFLRHSKESGYLPAVYGASYWPVHVDPQSGQGAITADDVLGGVLFDNQQRALLYGAETEISLRSLHKYVISLHGATPAALD